MPMKQHNCQLAGDGLNRHKEADVTTPFYFVQQNAICVANLEQLK